MAHDCEKNKARLTALAQLIGVYSEHGITDTSELHRLTGYGCRAIQKAKSELEFANWSSPLANYSSPSEPEFAEKTNQSSPSRTCAPAQNESSSKIVIRSSASAEGGVGGEEIPGLNGATATFVDVVAGLLAGPQGYPDRITSEKLLRGFVENYGADKTKRGILDLQCAMTERKNINVPKALPGFVANARVESNSTASPEKPKENWIEKRNREALEYLEKMEQGAAH